MISMSWMRPFAILMCLSLVGCAGSRGGPVPYGVADFGSPDIPAALEESRVYRAGIGDALSVRVFAAPEFSGDYTIDERGNLQMPLIGDVAVMGLTTAEISTLLETRLAARYLRHPDAVVSFKTQIGRRVTLDGSLRTPGIYAFSGNMTLMRAVAMGQGLTENANPRRVVVFRQIDGRRNAAAFDLTDIRGGLAPDPEIYAGDIVYVDGSTSRQLFRDFLSTVPLIAIFRPF